MTITVDGFEHELHLYDDDSGYGLARCGVKVGPWDLGPNDGEATCTACKAKVETREG